MSITLKQAQEAVGEGQDPNYWLDVLKANTAVRYNDMHEAAKALFEIIDYRDFKVCVSSGWQDVINLRLYDTNKMYPFRLRDDYTFDPDCPKTVDCANYESSCEGECENFKPKGRTLADALMDHEKYPFGCRLTINGEPCAKVASKAVNLFALVCKNSGGVGWSGSVWTDFDRFHFDYPTMDSFMESDITDIYKPESK
jgi:hypothetical protein